ncbi:MAG: ABC transporter substrate-binding protein [Pseudomonadota bacterium]|nr:ABC transporter substrate-binding protein [Pseudomonadota bacterium]
MIKRRTFLANTAATLAAPALAQAQTGPIRIGLLAPLTGVVAAGGKEMADDFTLFWNGVGNEVAGRKVEIITEDDGSNPDVALQKARRLVEQAKVDMLFGDLLANTGLAVANYVKGTGTPYFIPIIAADDLTQRARIPNVVRIAGYSASQTTRPLGDWALKQGYRRVAMISQDYTFGHEQCGGFAQTFTEGGGTIVAQLWNPLNTADFSPYMGQLADLQLDAVFAMETGADATRLIQAYASFGLKDSVPLIGSMNLTDQSVIRTLGDEALGIISPGHFAEGSDNPKVAAYVRLHQEKFGTIPSLYGFSMYSGAMWMYKALQTNGGRSDPASLLAAVAATDLDDSPLGTTVKLDSLGNPIYDVYIRKIVRNAQGKLWNVPIAEYPGVSQFWRYDPETYMKQPPYSRSFQGIKKS